MTSFLIAAAIVFCAIASSAYFFVPMLQRECAVTRRRDLFLVGESGLEMEGSILKRLLDRAMRLSLFWIGVSFLGAAYSVTNVEFASGTKKLVMSALLICLPIIVLVLPAFWHTLFLLAARDLRANREVRSAIAAYAIAGSAFLPLLAFAFAIAWTLVALWITDSFKGVGEWFLLPLGWLVFEYMIPFRSWNVMKRAYPYREEPEVSSAPQG